jgi:hypothetical protein
VIKESGGKEAGLFYDALFSHRTLAGQKDIGSIVLPRSRTGVCPLTCSAEEPETASAAPRIKAFKPGETLTYAVSWSKMIAAGTAVMEVREETLKSGSAVLEFFVTGSSSPVAHDEQDYRRVVRIHPYRHEAGRRGATILPNTCESHA